MLIKNILDFEGDLSISTNLRVIIFLLEKFALHDTKILV